MKEVLHLVFQATNRDTGPEWLPRVGPRDTVLLLSETGFTLDEHMLRQIRQNLPRGAEIRILGPAVKASSPSFASSVTDEEWVALAARHRVSLSWG